MSKELEMTPVHDAVRFADEGEPGFSRVRAWVAVLEGMHGLPEGAVRVELDARYVPGLHRMVPVARWWALLP